MLAQDFKPNRLEQAKAIVERIVEENPNGRIGVIVFSGSAMWQCPMTYDLYALRMFLQGVNVGVLPLGGTQISEAIILASKALNNRPTKIKTMFLISDGEDHDSKIKDAISAANDAGLKIFTIAIGAKEGAPIPIKDETGAIKDYVKDRSGQIVVSKVNPDLLQNVAKETGGKYFDASNQDIFLAISKAVRNLEKNQTEATKRNNKIDRFQIFLFLALLALFAQLLFPLRRKNNKA
jgi:Ca-activated chloride channel family protein